MDLINRIPDVNLPHVDISGVTKHWPWHQISKWWWGTMEAVKIVHKFINRSLDGKLSLDELYELWTEALVPAL